VAYTNRLGLLEVLFTNAQFREAEKLPGQIVPAMLAHSTIEGLLRRAVMQHNG